MKVGILGAGSIGTRHAENLRSLGISDLIVYDASAKARELFTERTGIAALPEEAAFWTPSLEAVVVATPTSLHVAPAIRALRQGCSLFVEKPLSHDNQGIPELIRLARQAQVTTLVGCNMRFHPGPARLKQALDGGIIGNLLSLRLQTGSYLPRWRPTQDYRSSYSADPTQGGIILDAIHEIDLALWLGGPARIAGCAARRARSLGLEVDGLCEMILRHGSGVTSGIHLNFVQQNYRRTIEAIGEEGSLLWDFARPEVLHYDREGRAKVLANWDADLSINTMYVEEMRHFLECASAGRPTQNPLEQAAETLAIALEARQWPDLFAGDGQ